MLRYNIYIYVHVGISNQRWVVAESNVENKSQSITKCVITCTLLRFHKSCCSFNAHNETTCHLWIKSATVPGLLNTKNSSNPCHHLVRRKLTWASQMQSQRGKYWARGRATKYICTFYTSNIGRRKKAPHGMKDLLACQDLWIHSCNENRYIMYMQV